MLYTLTKHILVFVLCCATGFSQSKFNQFLTASDTLNKPRRNLVVISEASIGVTTLVGLNQLWYADFKRSKFQTINDNGEWFQMDKLGHAFTAYQLGEQGVRLLNWSGVNKQDQLVYGATLGFAFLSAVEVLDGYSKAWGFSWGDILANGAGTSLYIGQELLWNEQRMALKYSFHQTPYAKLRPDKLGHNLLEQLLKDYNGQTYWLSANLYSFFNKSKIPKWLNVAVGYGGEGMLSGISKVGDISLLKDRRYRQYYISLDLNLNAIKTNSKLLKSLFQLFNMVKVPLPTLEVSRKRGVFHLFYL